MAQERDRLILAVPAGPRVPGQPRHSEGSRLALPTHSFLRFGVGLDYDMPPEQYYSDVETSLIQLAEFRGADIPGIVARGNAQVGIVGLDHVLNLPDEEKEHIRVLRELDYGICEFRLGVPIPKGPDGKQIYSPDSPEARARLEDVASLIGLEDPEELSVATALPILAQRIFRTRRVPVTIIPMDGHVENAIRYRMAHAIIDIAESGGTMIRNGIAPAERLESFEAVLISNDCFLDTGREKIKSRLLTRVDRALKNPGSWINPEDNNLLLTANGISTNGYAPSVIEEQSPQLAAS